MADNVVSLDTEQLKKELEALKRENKAAMQTIQKLLKDLSKKNEEITHLQELATKVVPVINPSEDKKSKLITNLTAEEEIAYNQLQRLREVAQSRQLTLEETKIFDLLVKNKRLASDESTVNLSKGNYRNVSEVDLLQIAGNPHVKDGNKS